MLVQLTISNFAIINQLETHFKTGLNILSGETGAGKSIIINAVNLILGGRASADLIRSGSDEARVEALFNIPENHAVNGLLSDLGFPVDRDLLIKRTISREGRNRIMVNGSMATLQMLSKIGLMLISISGQHEHQLLLRPENHLYLLDDFGGLTDEREDLEASFGTYQSLKEGFNELERKIKESEEKQALRRFQMEEIEKADLKPGEEGLLEEEKNRLRHAQELMHIVSDSYQTLYEKEDAVLSNIALCIKRIEKGIEMDSRLGAIRDAIASVHVELEDAALDLRNLQKSIVIDPRRLEDVDERLQFINRLKRKYGESVEEILVFRDNISKMVENLDQMRHNLEKIDHETGEMEKEVVSKATLLSVKRRDTAKDLENAMKQELQMLEMGGTQFEVKFHSMDAGRGNDARHIMDEIKPDGFDRVEFMISPNVGEDLRPLSRIASGGELSRIMLAMKTILARTASVETIIFDEVDAGISGATAEVVGEKLQSLAGYHQTLCITHLPQIASKGNTHFLVKKEVIAGRTQTVISKMDSEERVKEIARLLGGRIISQKAVAHAREMLG